ncbi:MAG TPA: monovalent cation/H(+) antiporter subunit G [Thermodesulfobacteriota bacterium]|nr:monovalent cation/H(+) antiporter subunit G [Thermodesulfobacteriota bacterium]
MAVTILLIFSLVAVWLSCLGLLAARNPYARLHFLGSATLLGSLGVAAAVLVQSSSAQSGIKAVLIFLILLFTSPIVSHVTARAVHGRRAHPRGKEK